MVIQELIEFESGLFQLLVLALPGTPVLEVGEGAAIQ
jgi:hypothetical protein